MGLHYVRALATISVVAVHAFDITALPKNFGGPILGDIFRFGAGEIDLFFIMSGYIMVVSTYDARTREPRFGAAEFLKRRAIRIFPMLWIAVASFAALSLLSRSGAVNPIGSLKTAILWPLGDTTPFVAWTIRYEILFYLIFAFAFIYNRNLWFLAVAWFSSPLFFVPFVGSGGMTPANWIQFLFSPFNIEFGLGVGLGFYAKYLGDPIKTSYQVIILVACFAILRILVWMTGLEAIWNSLPFVMILAPLCLIIVIFAIKTDPSHPSKVLVFIGDASYSIFLFHPHLVYGQVVIANRFFPSAYPLLIAIIVTLFTVMAASLIHILLERPIIKYAGMRFHTVPSNKKFAQKV